jgi:hypothetical protein
MSLREQYIEKANNLFERLLDEQPEEIEDEEDIDTGEDETEADDAAEEKGQAEHVEVFFDDLDENAQKVLIDKIKESLNISEDDNYAHQKLVEALSKKPLVTFRAEELVRKLNLDI